LAPLLRLLNEVKNLFGGFVLVVEKDLRFHIHPEEGEVDYAHVLPEISHLFSCTVDHVRDFVGDYKFQILCCELITNEQSVFDFNCANHVFRHHLGLLLLEGLGRRLLESLATCPLALLLLVHLF